MSSSAHWQLEEKERKLVGLVLHNTALLLVNQCGSRNTDSCSTCILNVVLVSTYLQYAASKIAHLVSQQQAPKSLYSVEFDACVTFSHDK